MAFSSQDESSDDVMNEINMTPLVDVMLVLLIIFIITVPVLKHSVNIDLPRASNDPEVIKPETINLSITADGNYHWDKEIISAEELELRMQAAARQEPQPDLHIYGDKEARYEPIAQAMATAQRTGLSKIGFVTDPSSD